MIQITSQFETEIHNKGDIKIRIGIHTGAIYFSIVDYRLPQMFYSCVRVKRQRFTFLMCKLFGKLRVYIAFLVHVNHIGIQIKHSKIQLNKLFSLLIQFNKIAINISETSLIKCKFTLPTMEK